MDILVTISVILGVLLVLGAILYHRYNGESPQQQSYSTIPGLPNPETDAGNLIDMAEAGSLHQFLVFLHQKFGDIAHFWWGRQMTVSICKPELFKQNAHLFDRPPELFLLFKDLFKECSISYANGSDGREKHKAYQRCFSERAVKTYFSVIQQNADVCIHKITEKSNDGTIALRETMFEFAIKTILQAVFGESSIEESQIRSLMHSYDIVWKDAEKQALGDVPTEESQRTKTVNKEIENIHSIMTSILNNKQMEEGSGADSDTQRLLFLDVVAKMSISEDEKIGDMVTIFVSGFHTTGLLLTWALYHLSKRPDCQDKLVKEVQQYSGGNPVTPEALHKLVYTAQVLEETLRCSVLAPYAARFHEEDLKIGGHMIPAGTPIISALGVSQHDPKRWPDPDKFDPDRFSPMNRKNIPAYGFEPFGYAGKRKCPGYRFAMVEAMVFLTTLLHDYEMKLVPGQVVTPEYGLLTFPNNEIWVTLSARK